jgi:hypothetical protein
MGQHDAYGKELFKQIAGGDFVCDGALVCVDYGNSKAIIDGVVDKNIAVEIESRVSKQIRGAVLDLICHPCPKKLLVILPVHANNPQEAAEQCKFILERFILKENFRVVLAKGTGDFNRFSEDSLLIRSALAGLGYLRN